MCVTRGTHPVIEPTTGTTPIGCWNPQLRKAGAAEIATSRSWGGTTFRLKDGLSSNANHAKIGVSIGDSTDDTVFGDLNQQGALSGKCGSSQNGSGGLFYIVNGHVLVNGIRSLLGVK